jgi:hypothetical protein
MVTSEFSIGNRKPSPFYPAIASASRRCARRLFAPAAGISCACSGRKVTVRLQAEQQERTARLEALPSSPATRRRAKPASIAPAPRIVESTRPAFPSASDGFYPPAAVADCLGREAARFDPCFDSPLPSC